MSMVCRFFVMAPFMAVYYEMQAARNVGIIKHTLTPFFLLPVTCFALLAENNPYRCPLRKAVLSNTWMCGVAQHNSGRALVKKGIQAWRPLRSPCFVHDPS